MSDIEERLNIEAVCCAVEGRADTAKLLDEAQQTIARLQQELRVARSEAIQAKAQAAVVAAERDGLQAKLSDAQTEASQATEGYEYERQARILAMQQRDERAKERDTAQSDARQLAQAFKSAINSVEEWGNYAPQWAKDKWELYADLAALDTLFEQYGEKYLEPTP